MTFSADQIPVYIAAVGALGVAAFGAVEAIGKTLFVFPLPGTRHMAGLPYVGFGKVRALTVKVGPALKAAYGADYEKTLLQQYRAGRGKGQGPETIRQGVRLGLPFLGQEAAAKVIADIWGMPHASAVLLAAALIQSPAQPPPADAKAPTDEALKEAQALAARFATALDTRVQAAFDSAEEVYETRAQFWAAIVALGLSLGYEAIQPGVKTLETWVLPVIVGLVAVPLAPAAKDLSSSLSDALGALGKLRGAGK
jgi:hypothetical protein